MGLWGAALVVALIITLGSVSASAMIMGETGTNFQLTTKDGYISAPDGNQIYAWGYGMRGGGAMQYPGPTLIVNQGALITVSLINELPAHAGNVSMLFPGHKVTAAGGVLGALTREAPPDGATEVTYTFRAEQPGTYIYFSGTRTDLQVDMGLTGAIIVRPSMMDQAYNHADTAYDREYLFFLSEMDLLIHQQVEAGLTDQVDTTTFFPTYWFLNGRSAPDTMAMAEVPWLPLQPYDCMPRMLPGERMLARFVGGGRDSHPFHHHGNNSWVIAQDGRMPSSGPGAGPDLGWSDFTHTILPGSTLDAIFTWNGEGLGWDMYGHEQDIDNVPTGNFPGAEDVDHNGNSVLDNVDPEPGENLADHGKPLPVFLPHQSELTFGAMYSGSPFMGGGGSLPPGQGGMNPNAGFTFMWHSHNEKEMTTNDVFPGGLMTHCIIDPPGTVIGMDQ
jgi:hypothetical protein